MDKVHPKVFSATLKIQPHPSRQLLFFIVITHLLAFAVAVYYLQPYWLSAVFTFLLLISCGYLIRRYVLRLGHSVVGQVIWTTAGDWKIAFDDDEWQEATLLGSTLVHPMLLVLHFTRDKASRFQKFVLVLPPDSLDTDTQRRLRARLRMTVLDNEQTD